MNIEVKNGIGDINSQEKGSGARFNAGKPDFALIPFCTLEDEARVWMYGKEKYSQRGDCTCSAGNAKRQHGPRAADCVENTTKSSYEQRIPNMPNDNAPTDALGTPPIQTLLNPSKSVEVKSADLIQNTRKIPSTAEFSHNTDSEDPSTMNLLHAAAQSADQARDRMLTTAMQPVSSAEYSAIPATSALDLSKGLAIGLAEHSPTCGVHKAVKTAAWNWTKGMDWSVPFACAMRHMAAWQRGEENDPESGLPHLAHAQCNLRMLTLYAKTFPQGDDRPVKELQP